ncbi:regulatory protein [Pelomonas aquatica]|uniref:Regulatory protein RecX n=1 Tax=Pelomonas aquatica TaxID=431058 RepID=A0ABU1ZG61_9BURK|nr:regulatory protein RecX [Pelomonas aquatica]MDR7299621.1 regulatory protein [Pelomonas aquatica]
MARAPLSLKARAIGLLAQREHSRAELRRKLLRIELQQARRAALALAKASAATSGADDDGSEPAAGYDAPTTEAAVDALLDALAADGYLNETRFVESRLHVRAGRFGAQRIQQELAQHGLKLDAEQQAALRATELERAREVWLRRFGAEPAPDATERARQSRFLLARGFAPEVVRRLLRA